MPANCERAALHLRELFESDPNRADALLDVAVGDLVVDWSRHLATAETVELLLALARPSRCGRADRGGAEAGDPVNATEGRAALHTALRARSRRICGDQPRRCDAGGAGRARPHGWLCGRAVRSAERRGATGTADPHGGEPRNRRIPYLGLAMAHEALAAFRHRGLDCHFVANVDPADLATVLGDGLDPSETLFVVVSKSFTTAETLANARSARAWVTSALGPGAVDRHFAAVTANTAAAAGFGIGADSVFAMWDWVGGRYSLGSAAGLSLMIAIGDGSLRRDAGRDEGSRRASRPATAGGQRPGAHGTAGRVVPQLLGPANQGGAALCAAAAPAARLPAAAPHGVQRQAGGSRREYGRLRNRLDRLGRGRHWRPALLSPAAAPGHHGRPRRLHRVRPARRRHRPSPRSRGVTTSRSSPTASPRRAALAFGAASDDPHRELPGNRPSTDHHGPRAHTLRRSAS